ncbi:N-acetylmuramic acid 6-phosphate etherase [Eisenibacter elegans]|jgi:N-acetylmuramic acid 6-phosphate etherase|uniref:N-acetylmuramic acid 6-phosphate etherase n=1 Tax=Eisenibacter elegans TaxID=997 RepID=UPI0003FB7C11|nr:N-acetylmuramic acid 6-phosphate etherase [Eisenibacter elegans]
MSQNTSSTTESASPYRDLEQQSIATLLQYINQEDQTVPLAIARALPQIETLIAAIVPRMQAGGRLFYIGAGTSGRLGIVDASECPPTFGVPHDRVIGLIAGGDSAIRKAVEFAEDDPTQAWQDLQAYQPQPEDILIGIAASGRTPYVIGGVSQARAFGMLTGCIVCNTGSALAKAAALPVEVVVGPELISGSTRMKAGTAQKLVLNMISTVTMIQLGRVVDNKMVDMQLSNHKLIERGTKMLVELLQIPTVEAADLLQKHGSVRAAAKAFEENNMRQKG